MLIVIKILLMPLTGPDNPLLCHYFCYYLKWVYDNEMFTLGNTLNCPYGGLGDEISDLHSLRAVRLMAVSPGSKSQGTGLDCFTSWYLFPSVVDKPAVSYNLLILPSTGHAGDLGMLYFSPGVPGGRHASTCTGTQFLGGQPSLTCPGI